MDPETIMVIGMFVTPLYALILYRMKKSDKIEKKVTKLCTAMKIKFPELAKILD